jgi:D-alanyl-D-alanine carboxypeptidase/D-alanyl-D-alanine-endopeptidase (penicillin-binding protein 4)
LAYFNRSFMQILLAAAVLALPLCAAAQLTNDLHSIVRNAALGQNGFAGVSVVDLNSGATIFEHRANEPMVPASNMKLLTSASAVKVLGPDYAFVTDINITTDGKVVIIGSGDPALADPEVMQERSPSETPHQLFAAFADVVSTNRTKIKEIVIDDRVFDREMIHPDWPRDQLERWYCAPVQGINVHSNVLAFYPSPGNPDTGTTADISPSSPWIAVENRSRRVTEGRNAVWVQRTESDNNWVIRGSIRAPSQSPIEVSLHEPAMYFGNIIADRISSRGVLVGNGRTPQEAVRLAGEHEPFKFQGQALARHTSTLDEILYRVNYDSHNMYAEALLKKMGNIVTGEPGSWSNGGAVIRMLISERLGPDHAASMVIRDGSGMSRENKIRPSTFTAWLHNIYNDDEIRPAMLASLPTGTTKLRQRFRLSDLKHSLYAKTGTINKVRCLSGYVINEETGQGAAFSVLVNGLGSGDAVTNSKRLHKEVVEALDRNMHTFAMPRNAEQLVPQLGG